MSKYPEPIPLSSLSDEERARLFAELRKRTEPSWWYTIKYHAFRAYLRVVYGFVD